MIERASLSTMWAIGRYTSMSAFVAQAQKMGFGQVEANYQLTLDMLAEMTRLKDQGQVEISSVHDPASLPPGVLLRGLPQLSALDEAQRQNAVTMSRKALDIAARLGARLMVVHTGRIPELSAPEAALRELLNRGAVGSEAYEDLLQYLVKERVRLREPYLAALTRSLEEIASYGAERGIILGLENRYYYHELPLVDEAERLLDSLSAYGTGYWHDVGHAHALQVMGFVGEMDWLQSLGSRLVGMHLHDAVGMRDHLAPGLGEVDFGKLLPYVPANAMRVCELGTFNTEQEVMAGLSHLQQYGYF